MGEGMDSSMSNLMHSQGRNRINSCEFKKKANRLSKPLIQDARHTATPPPYQGEIPFSCMEVDLPHLHQ